MKICLVQSKSKSGNIQENIKNHLNLIKRAIEFKADLIIFPELSVTGYEPPLANELASNKDDRIFVPFQTLANENGISIGVGMPLRDPKGIKISMLIFQPNQKILVYSKQQLHSGETPYFVNGNHQTILNIKGLKIGIGICFETLQRNHFINAQQQGMDIYIASVAKSQKGIDKAYSHFPNIAKEFSIPILMSNCYGFCDNFETVGQSAVWNEKGILIGQLDDKHTGLIIYDSELAKITTYQPIIEKGKTNDLEALLQIYLNAKSKLIENGIHQWTDNYPTKTIIENDLKAGVLFQLKIDNEIIGAINLSEEQETEYQTIPWEFDDTKVLVIHRLVIDPKYQGKGHAHYLMDFAENYAISYGYKAITSFEEMCIFQEENLLFIVWKKRSKHPLIIFTNVAFY